MRIPTLAIGLLLAFTGASLAQGNAPNSGQNNTQQNNRQTSNSQAQAQHPQNLRQEVQTNLQSAGFTDIKIMPEAFLVRAKDKSGNPVMMVINPDSITAVTEVEHQNGGGQNNQTGATAQNRGQNNQTGGTTQNRSSANPTGGAPGQSNPGVR